jgi:hypothetical protein
MWCNGPCSRCAICLSCGSNDPGFNCTWQKSFTECGPCASHTTCPSCSEPYGEGDLIIQCVQCERCVLSCIHGDHPAVHIWIQAGISVALAVLWQDLDWISGRLLPTSIFLFLCNFILLHVTVYRVFIGNQAYCTLSTCEHYAFTFLHTLLHKSIFDTLGPLLPWSCSLLRLPGWRSSRTDWHGLCRKHVSQQLCVAGLHIMFLHWRTHLFLCFPKCPWLYSEAQ